MSAPRKHERPKGSIRRPIAKLRTVEEKDGGYPSVGDQLDALWKGFAALADGKAAPAESLDMLARIQATKTRFPKR